MNYNYVLYSRGSVNKHLSYYSECNEKKKTTAMFDSFCDYVKTSIVNNSERRLICNGKKILFYTRAVLSLV